MSLSPRSLRDGRLRRRPLKRRAGVGCAAVLAALALAEPAAADEPFASATLTAEVAAGCNDGRTLERQVETALGRRVFVADGDVRVQLRTQRTADGHEAQLTLTTRDGAPLGTRTVTAPEPSCAALDERLALVLALMIDLRRNEVVIVRLPARPKAPKAPKPPKPPTAAPPPLPRREFALGATGTLGWLAPATLGLRAAGTLGLGMRTQLLLGAEWTPTQGRTTALGSYEATAGAALVGACFELLERGPFLGAGCGELRVGVIEARGGADLATAQAARTALGEGLARLRLDSALSGFLAVRVGVAIGASFEPLRVAVLADGEPLALHSAWPVVPSAELALVLRAPR